MILMLLVRVHAPKKSEFVLSARSLAPTPHAGCSFSILQSVDDTNLLHLVAEWDSGEDCRRYLASEPFRALRGAADVLGTFTEWRVLDDVGIPRHGK